jgi:hypothetical protein
MARTLICAARGEDMMQAQTEVRATVLSLVASGYKLPSKGG